jgi:ABC-2 type transport system permease protein
MSKTLVIAGNSLRRLLRDRSNLFFVFVLPMVLILVLGLVFGSGFTTLVAVVVPADDARALALYEEIADTTAFEASQADDEAAARRRLRRNDIDAVIVIPDGYGGRLDAGEDVEIGYYATVSAGGIDVQAVVEAAVAEQGSTVRAARFAAEQAGASPDAALAAAVSVGEAMPMVETVLEGDAAGDASGGADTNAAQQLLLFMFLTALASSTALIQSRRLGVSERMFSTPTTAGTIIAGETLGRFLVVMVQGIFIVLAAGALFGVDWGDPIAAMLVVTAFALTGTGAGMLLGSTFSNEQQASGVAIFGALILAALGGSMVPLEIFPEAMVTIAHLTPHAWGNDAFTTLILHNGTVPDIATEVMVLTCYGLALIMLAALVFRRRLTH